MPGDGINKLGSDTDLITDLPGTSLQDISHAQLAAYVRDLTARFLYVNAELRATTASPPPFARSVMISSVKCSGSGSPLMFANGSTATDGFSHTSSPGPASADCDPGGASPRVEESTRPRYTPP